MGESSHALAHIYCIYLFIYTFFPDFSFLSPQAFRYALATGNWGIMSTRGNTAQSGVAQQLGRMTVPATLSLLRKVRRKE